MKKIFIIIIAVLLIALLALIIIPKIIKTNTNEDETLLENKCEFSAENIGGELPVCMQKSKKRDFTVTINNIILNNETKTAKIIYDKDTTTLQLYFDDVMLFEEKNIDDSKTRIHDIKIINNDVLLVSYYLKSDTPYNVGNIKGFDYMNNNVFELREDDSYYVVTDITDEGKINFNKYLFDYVTAEDNNIIEEEYETSYTGESTFSDYNLIKTNIIEKN